MIIEAFTGLIFVLAWLRFGASIQLLTAIIFSAIFIVLSIADFENQKMPAIFVYSATVFALLLATAHAFTHAGPDLSGSILGFAAGFGLLAIVWLIFKWTGKNIMDFGNVWIAGMIGASIGFLLVVPALVIALLAGAVFAGGWWLITRKGPDSIPTAAILCCSALIIMYMGQFIIGQIWPF
jgi:leader peptidase (prepilin peptidase) / N-methyltransferase